MANDQSYSRPRHFNNARQMIGRRDNKYLPPRTFKEIPQRRNFNVRPVKRTCQRCGYQDCRGQEACRAFNAYCYNCKGHGHFSRTCRKVQACPGQDCEADKNLTERRKSKTSAALQMVAPLNQNLVLIKLGHKCISALLDTGSTITAVAEIALFIPR